MAMTNVDAAPITRAKLLGRGEPNSPSSLPPCLVVLLRANGNGDALRDHVLTHLPHLCGVPVRCFPARYEDSTKLMS